SDGLPDRPQRNVADEGRPQVVPLLKAKRVRVYRVWPCGIHVYVGSLGRRASRTKRPGPFEYSMYCLDSLTRYIRSPTVKPTKPCLMAYECRSSMLLMKPRPLKFSEVLQRTP